MTVGYTRSALAALIVTAVTIGCSRGPEFAPVEGRVTSKGKPLGDVLVSFLPDPEEGSSGPRSTGLTDEQGYFNLSSDKQRSGALVGKHRVVLIDARSIKSGGGARALNAVHTEEPDPSPKLNSSRGRPHYPPSRVPRIYYDATTTPFHQDVPRGGQWFELEVRAQVGGR
jgi:hypothetical protein